MNYLYLIASALVGMIILVDIVNSDQELTLLTDPDSSDASSSEYSVLKSKYPVLPNWIVVYLQGVQRVCWTGFWVFYELPNYHGKTFTLFNYKTDQSTSRCENIDSDILPTGSARYLGSRALTEIEVYHYQETIFCGNEVLLNNKGQMGDIRNTSLFVINKKALNYFNSLDFFYGIGTCAEKLCLAPVQEYHILPNLYNFNSNVTKFEIALESVPGKLCDLSCSGRQVKALMSQAPYNYISGDITVY